MSFFKFMAQWGVWDIVAILLSLTPTILVLIYILPRKAVDNLYIDTKLDSVNQTYSKVIRVELRNHTNELLYILSQGFVFGPYIRPSPHGAKDAATGVFEIKFEGRKPGVLSEIDTLLRPNQVVTTWIPVDPKQSDESLTEALRNRYVGHLRFKLHKISDRPHPFKKLKVPV